MTTGKRFDSPQWRDLNEWRSYPFTDDATILLENGDQIPTSLLVDARLHIPGASGEVGLVAFNVYGTYIEILVGKQGSTQIATAKLTLNNPEAVLSLRDADGTPAGVLVAGSSRWAELSGLSVGEYNVVPGTANFVPGVCVSVPSQVQRMLGPGGEALGDSIRIVGEDGVRLECDYRDGVLVITPHVIGDPLYKTTACDVDAARANQVIEHVVFQSGDTLIECQPNDEGRIFILPATYQSPDAALRVASSADGIRFSLAGKTLERA